MSYNADNVNISRFNYSPEGIYFEGDESQLSISDDVVIPGTANPQRNSQIDPQVASYSSCTYSAGETLANSYLSHFHEVHNDDVLIENGANELNDIIYDSEVHNNDVIIEDSENECHDNVIDNMAIKHFNRNFSEHSSASENENIKQIDITCEDKPEETFQNEQTLQTIFMTQNMNTCATI